VLTRADAYRLCVVNLVTGNPFYGLTNVNTSNAPIYGNAGSPEPLGVNTWAFLVGTYVDDEVQLYIDGQLEGTMTFPAGPRLNNRVLTLGDRYAGLIDELRLQAAPRSADWITIQHLSTTDALLQYGSPTPID
jgi:hypothetical protein